MRLTSTSKVLLGVENHVGGAGFAGELGFGRRGDGGDDAGADVFGDLGEEQADATGPGMNQGRVSRLEREDGTGEVVGGHSLQHGGGGLLGSDAGRGP